MSQTPTPEALAKAKDIVAFLDAHTCIHSPGCLACMLEERIALALTEQAREREKERTEMLAIADRIRLELDGQAQEIERLKEDNERLRAESGYHAAADVIVQLTAQRDAIERATWEAAIKRAEQVAEMLAAGYALFEEQGGLGRLIQRDFRKIIDALRAAARGGRDA